MKTEIKLVGGRTLVVAVFADGHRLTHRFFYKRQALAEAAILERLDEERALTHLVAHSHGVPCNCAD